MLLRDYNEIFDAVLSMKLRSAGRKRHEYA